MLERDLMDPVIVILVILISYLIGAISFTRVVVGIVKPGDKIEDYEMRVSSTGERFNVASIGATSASAVLGARMGMVIGALDILKATAVVLSIRLLYPAHPEYYLIAAVAVMIGHIWPVYYHFRGGSGFSSIAGGLLVIDPLAMVVCPLIGMVIGMLILRDVIGMFLLWIVLLIPYLWFTTHNMLFVWYAIAINVIFVIASLPQIRLILPMMLNSQEEQGYGQSYLGSTPMARGYIKIARLFKPRV
jgi:acyl phosphate:glycerol-3-phosphate acyltransferase